MRKSNLLSRIPPASNIRARLESLDEQVRQLRILLRVAEELEASPPDESAVDISVRVEKP